jgi:hypothetical protein
MDARMTDIRTIRPSSLTTYQDCPRRFAARHLADDLAAAGYQLRTLGSVHIGAAVGSGVHAAASYTLEEKRTTGTLGNDGEAEDRAVEEFDNRVEHGVDWDATTANLSTAKKQLARMSKVYRRLLAPSITPILVEKRLTADIGDGWEVSGQLDTMAGDPDRSIRDLKTGVQQRANGVQYATYAMLFASHGFQATELLEDFLQRVRIDKEQPPPTTHRIDIMSAQADAMEAMDGIKRDTALFLARVADRNGRPAPSAFRPNPASSLCAARWCPAWGTEFCKAHKRQPGE